MRAKKLGATPYCRLLLACDVTSPACFCHVAAAGTIHFLDSLLSRSVPLTSASALPPTDPSFESEGRAVLSSRTGSGPEIPSPDKTPFSRIDHQLRNPPPLLPLFHCFFPTLLSFHLEPNGGGICFAWPPELLVSRHFSTFPDCRCYLADILRGDIKKVAHPPGTPARSTEMTGYW